MPLLGAGDLLPRRPQRVLVAGTSGAGKTTLARAVAGVLVRLDLPRRVVMRRVILRTVGRRVRREVLWNGNQEPPFRTFLTDRDHIVRWAWRTHARTGSRVLAAHATRPELVVVRLTTPAQVSAWVAGPLRASAYC